MDMSDMLHAFEYLKRRKQNYQLVFSSPAGQEVMIDLARFCRAAETCVIPGDSDKTLVLEGRREVFLRIQTHIRLTNEQLYALLAGHQYDPRPKEEDNG